jgi:hypothetical protein
VVRGLIGCARGSGTGVSHSGDDPSGYHRECESVCHKTESHAGFTCGHPSHVHFGYVFNFFSFWKLWHYSLNYAFCAQPSTARTHEWLFSCPVVEAPQDIKSPIVVLCASTGPTAMLTQCVEQPYANAKEGRQWGMR